MILKMIETTPVSTTGLNKIIWEKGEIYNAPEDLARNLVKGKLAILKPGTTLPEETPEDNLDKTETPEDDETKIDSAPLDPNADDTRGPEKPRE